ncbi:hypothetical protein [Amycolatopsis sp. lyj-346]|uniref:hypothetical protein n=1 Tax=Amycolatopsis sp. lyj-346 TaxID=2789289 RepID=UPI003978CEB9
MRLFLRIGSLTELGSPAVEVRGLQSEEQSTLFAFVEPYWTVQADADPDRASRVEVVGRPEVSTSDAEEGYWSLDGRRVLIRRGDTATTTVLRVINVVRAIFKVALVGLGGVNCHSGVLDSGGHGVLVTGARGAGKTTVVRVCAASGMTVVANDQCVLLPGEPARAIGFPALVAVRTGSSPAGCPLPDRPLLETTDRQDGRPRRRYTIQSVAEASGSLCSGHTTAELLVSYAKTAEPGVLALTPGSTVEWLTAAGFGLPEAYGPDLIHLATTALGVPSAEHRFASVRAALRNTVHYRITCAADRLAQLPGRFPELMPGR